MSDRIFFDKLLIEKEIKLREITSEQIVNAVKMLVIEANYKLDKAIIDKFRKSIEEEKSETAKRIFKQLIEE